MSRSIICTVLAALFTALQGLAHATPSDQPARTGSDWRARLCANCQPESEAASRIRDEARIATKLVAANTCADPGPVAWFAEEEDHVSAFLNSTVIRYK